MLLNQRPQWHPVLAENGRAVLARKLAIMHLSPVLCCLQLARRPYQLDVLVRSAVPFVLEPDWAPVGDREMLVLQVRAMRTHHHCLHWASSTDNGILGSASLWGRLHVQFCDCTSGAVGGMRASGTVTGRLCSKFDDSCIQMPHQ
jgi:hypothetical protein